MVNYKPGLVGLRWIPKAWYFEEELCWPAALVNSCLESFALSTFSPASKLPQGSKLSPPYTSTRMDLYQSTGPVKPQAK